MGVIICVLGIVVGAMVLACVMWGRVSEGAARGSYRDAYDDRATLPLVLSVTTDDVIALENRYDELFAGDGRQRSPAREKSVH